MDASTLLRLFFSLVFFLRMMMWNLVLASNTRTAAFKTVERHLSFCAAYRTVPFQNQSRNLRLKRYCVTASLRGGAARSWDNVGSSLSKKKKTYRVYLAVGSNLGDRFSNIRSALQLLNQTVVRTSFLYETAPFGVVDQPPFLNGAVEIETNLPPLELLRTIKQVEADLGRNFSEIRNGPRPIDLDILLYYKITAKDDSDSCSKNAPEAVVLETSKLTVPHIAMHQRDFVLIPLMDAAGTDIVHPVLNITLGETFREIQSAATMPDDDAAVAAEETVVRVLPLPRKRFLYFNRTIIMGILNVTPDSFSDGGKYSTTQQSAVQRALEMEDEGADIIDIGGESTRPGALEIEIDEELRRTIPVIQGIRKESDIPISIDTRHVVVAKAAVQAGADIVNDVSGGTFDPDMLAAVGEAAVPMIIMHMRGTPETMQSMANDYNDVVTDVASALLHQSNVAARNHDIHRWQQVVDPGIGFAKDVKGNLLLLKNMSRIRFITGDLPILIGISRKGFIGKIAGVSKAEQRDAGTIASFVASLCLEQQPKGFSHYQNCNIIRVHNVAECKQAAMIMDAIRNA